MKKIYKWSGILLATLWMCGSCSNESEVLNEQPAAASLNVSFELGGSVGNLGPSGRASELHTEAEKQLHNLWVIAFKDIELTGEVNSHPASDDDTFFKAIKVELPADGGTKFSFTLGEEGDFQVCFIANAHGKLQEYFQSGNISTIADLKQHLVDQSSADKVNGLLMTSDFRYVKSSWTEPFDLQTVDLTRVMARIDVYNDVPGMTIQQIKFINRATKTRLYQGAAIGWESDITLADTVYTDFDNVGNNCTEKIYTYEQKANTEQSQTGQIPALEITYTTSTAPNKPKVHKVDLVYKNAEGEVTSIGLKRNYLYKVRFTRSATNISASLKVLDWNEGDEIEVPSNEIGGGEDITEDTGNGIVTDPSDGGDMDVIS